MTIRGPFAVILLVVLVLSVAGNLVIAGFALARIAGPRQGGEIERVVAIGIRAFPPPIREAIGKATREQRDAFRARIDEIRDARQRMFETMRAEPFDRAKLDAAYADLRAKTNDLQRVGQEIVAGAVAEASPETRSLIQPPRGPFP